MKREDWRRRRGCLDKARYASRQSAKKAVERGMQKHGVVLYTYRCPYCDQIHLTRKPQA